MKKNVKAFLSVLMVVAMLWAACVSVYAADTRTGITPRMDHCDNYVMSFAVIDPGVAEFMVSYNGNPVTFVHAKLTVTFQKKFMGLFWRTVDIGTTDNAWIAFCGDLQGDFYDTVTMNGTGTYRANFKLEILGVDGSIDVIEETIDCKYN